MSSRRLVRAFRWCDALGTPLDRFPRGRGVARVGPVSSLTSERSKSFHESPSSALARDLAIAITLLGSTCRQPRSASRACLPLRAWRSSAPTFGCTVLAWLALLRRRAGRIAGSLSIQPLLFRPSDLRLDELNAPIVPTVALLHFLTALSTARTFMRRFSFSWSMAAETIRLLTFSCKEPWVLIALLAARLCRRMSSS